MRPNVTRPAMVPSLFLAGDLPPDEGGSGGERGDLLVAHVARRPAEAAVRVQRELVGRAHLEYPADALRHALRRLLLEALDVHHARPEAAAVAVLLPEVDLRQLAAGERQHELVGARLERAREVGRVRARKARAPEAVAETDVKTKSRLHTVCGQVEEPGHFFAGHIAARGLVELDPRGARGHERLQLLVDDFSE